jgi:hypothetical protein
MIRVRQAAASLIESLRARRRMVEPVSHPPGRIGSILLLCVNGGHMKKTLAPSIGLVCMLLTGHAAAQIVFYEGEGLRGRSFTANRAIDNLDNFGFNDRASSAIVERGQWEVCEHAFFAGRCITLRRG